MMPNNMQPDLITHSAAALLQTACPSIRSRIRNEILGHSPSQPGMPELQQLILQDPLVRQVSGWAQPDGWLGWDFHGSQSIEAGIRILCEKGVERCQPVLAKALDALQRHPDRLERGIGKVGRVLDDAGFGGSSLIQAATLARAGLEDAEVVKQQVQVALDGFAAAACVRSIAELAERYRDHQVFRAGLRWPGIYHLRLLAFTHAWRTAENVALAAAAVQRLVDLSPLPDIHVRHHSQLIAPASYAMQDFNPDMAQMDDVGWMLWLHRTECLARMGIVPLVPELRAQVQRLAALLQEGGGRFQKALHHPYFTKWGSYTGLALEPDWRSSQRRMNDLTFRSLLIIHFATAPQGVPGPKLNPESVQPPVRGAE